MTFEDLQFPYEEKMRCDVCRNEDFCQLFGTFYLCAKCLIKAMDALGLDAAGLAAERLSELTKRYEKAMREAVDMRGSIQEISGEVERVYERLKECRTKIMDIVVEKVF